MAPVSYKERETEGGAQSHRVPLHPGMGQKAPQKVVVLGYEAALHLTCPKGPSGAALAPGEGWHPARGWRGAEGRSGGPGGRGVPMPRGAAGSASG